MNGNYCLIDLRKLDTESTSENNAAIFAAIKKAAERNLAVLCLTEAGEFFSKAAVSGDEAAVSVVAPVASEGDSETVWTPYATTYSFTKAGACTVTSVEIAEQIEPTPAEPELPIAVLDNLGSADDLWEVLEPLATANRSIRICWEGDEENGPAIVAQLNRVVGEDSDTIYLTWEEDDTAVKFIQWTFVNASDTITKTEATYTLTADV